MAARDDGFSHSWKRLENIIRPTADSPQWDVDERHMEILFLLDEILHEPKFKPTDEDKAALLAMLEKVRVELSEKPKKSCALIIVDPQNDFGRPNGSLYVPNGEEVVDEINKFRVLLGDYIKATFITQDWHPTDHVSFATNHEGASLFSTIVLPDKTTQKLWPPHCVQGSEGADFLDGLIVKSTDIIIQKGITTETDSYSGFGSEDHIKECTSLLSFIKELDITHVIVVGLALEYCVSFTVKDACRNSLATCVYIPACRGISVEDCVKEMDTMKSMGAIMAYGPAGLLEFAKMK